MDSHWPANIAQQCYISGLFDLFVVCCNTL